MEPTSLNSSHGLLHYLEPVRIGRWLVHRHVRFIAAWIVALIVAGNSFYIGWNCMNDPNRLDGNTGHVNIDFSGQYLLGRMIVKGDGHYLYRRSHYEAVLKEAYPIENETKPKEGEDSNEAKSDKAAPKHDYEDIPDSMIGQPDDGDVHGPLYPPVHAMLFAPLAWLPPLLAYRTLQFITFLLTFMVAYLAERISEGRLWCPVALVLVFFLPGYMGALGLGQNPLYTLTILMVGWFFLKTERPVLAGIAWGFLAYKPVWAVAFLPVLLLTGRWRASGAMILTGVALGLATLPLVGLDSEGHPSLACWFDWLEMGRIASDRYAWDENWLVLSRDLFNLPRRLCITHTPNHLPEYAYRLYPSDDGKMLPDILSYSLWIGVILFTVLVALFRRKQVSAIDGPGPAFLLLGGWMSCWHFMYYDVMLTYLPVVLLFTEPNRYWQAVFLGKPLSDGGGSEMLPYYQPQLFKPLPPMPLLPGGTAARWVVNPLPPLLLFLLLITTPIMIWHDPSYRYPPVDTFCIMLFWAWCSIKVLRREAWHSQAEVVPALDADEENAYPLPAHIQ